MPPAIRRPAALDREAELQRELEVALVVRRDRHDRPGAVSHQHVVGYEDRDSPAGGRIDGDRPGEHAGLLAPFRLTLELRLLRCELPVPGDGLRGCSRRTEDAAPR